MAALATISSGLSCGRLLGPPLAALMLSVNPVAPLWLMAIAPLIALLLVLREVADPRAAGGTPGDPSADDHAAVPAAGDAAGGAGEPDAARPVTAPQPLAGRQRPGYQPSCCAPAEPAALATLAAQFPVVRPQHFSPLTLLCMAAVLMVAGLALMYRRTGAVLWDCYHFARRGNGNAGLSAAAERSPDHGEGAGAIATSHTLGYGVSALLVPVVTRFSANTI